MYVLQEPKKTHDTTPDQPHGREGYEFSDNLALASVEARVSMTESYLANTKACLDAVCKTSADIVTKYTEIGTLLKEFKKKLELDDNIELPSCFRRLRELVGNHKRLEISEGRPPTITVGKNVDESAMEVIGVFNQVLRLCDKFPAECADAEKFIREKLQMMQSEGVQTHSTLEAQEHSEQLLKRIKQLNQRINNLNSDINVAKASLSQRCNHPVTTTGTRS